jgi:choline kinase
MKRLVASCIAPTRPQNKNLTDITIIILAANICYGMKSYGPKTLLTIHDQVTLLEYQIDLLNTVFPNSDIILVVGFLADKIIKKRPPNVRIIENQLYETTNEIEQVRLALNCALTNNVLIIKDNVIFNVDTLKEIEPNKSCIIYDSQNKIDKSDVGVTIVDNCATIFSYDLPTKWGHVVYLCNKDLSIFKNYCSNRNYSKMYLFEVLNMLLHKIGKIQAIEPKNMEIVKIDTSRDLEKIRTT